MSRVSRKQLTQVQIVQDVSETKIYKTALYARLSREDNLSNSESIENQIAFIESYIADRPYLQQVGIFSDNGFTGTDFFRPKWKELMEKVQAGEVNCIIVKDLSRLGRNYIETGNFLEKICPFFGVRFIAITDNYDTETSEANGMLSVSLSNIINDYYAKDISRKVSASLRSKMQNGEYIGNWAKYGYMKSPDNKNLLVVNPETAPIVQMIFRWRSEGISYMGINKKLNDMEILSPSQYKIEKGIVTNNNQKSRKILWNKHIVTDILKDITYIGHLAQRKTAQCLYVGLSAHSVDESDWIVVHNTHEAIISEELFLQVQAINQAALAKQKENLGKYDHLPKAENIYGKRFICADCGAVMKLYRSFNTKKDKVYFTYKCPTHGEHGARACNPKRIKKEVLDESVFHAIKAQMEIFIDIQKSLQQLTNKKKTGQRKFSKDNEIKSLKVKIEHKKSLFSSMYCDLKEGLLSQEDYAQHREILFAEIKELEVRIQELEQMKIQKGDGIPNEKHWDKLIKKYSKAEAINAELVESFIESIKLNADNSLDISFKHINEFEEYDRQIEKLRKEIA